MDQSVILQLFIGLASAAAIYGGIRADLRNMRESINDVRSIGIKAHDRIDNILRD